MPPKGQNAPKGSKVVADKTFGLKNKKGSKQQKAIHQLAQSAKNSGTPEEKKKQADKAAKERELREQEKARKDTAELFKPTQVQRIAFGVDPKTVVCVFFKKGNCDKGMWAAHTGREGLQLDEC